MRLHTRAVALRVAGLLGVVALLVVTVRASQRPTVCFAAPPPHPPSASVAWEYEFLDSFKSKLEAARRHLETRGFQFDGYHHGPCWPCDTLTLRLVRTVAYNAESIRDQEAELCNVARDHHLEMFWAMLPTERKYWVR